MADNDLISRQALLEAYDRAHEGAPGKARRLIEEAEAVDAVEVIRCKDCIHARPLDKYEAKLYLPECVGCTYHSKSYSSMIMMGTDFCSYGEKIGVDTTNLLEEDEVCEDGEAGDTE